VATGLRDGDRDGDGLGDGVALDGGVLAGSLTGIAFLATTGAPCAPSTMTSIVTPASTATMTAVAAATADRKLMSSIRAYSALRSRLPRSPPVTT
jgi:hypothetical protein